jgi:hypothetical protein
MLLVIEVFKAASSSAVNMLIGLDAKLEFS